MEELRAQEPGKVLLTDERLYMSFLDYLDVKPKSIESYRTATKQFLQYLMINEITQPTRETIIAYRDYLLIAHKASTVQNYLTAVKLFFAWMEQEGIYKDVAKHVKGVKVSRAHKKDYLTQHQSRRVLNTIDTATLTGLRDYALIALLLTTGIRTIEATRADVGDLQTVGGFTVLYVQGKGQDEKAQYVKIAEPVEDALRDYLSSREGGAANKHEPLFASTSNNSRGERMTTRSIRRIVKDTLRRAGYDSDRLTAHSMRHTAATLNLLSGGTLEETQQLLRHQSISTTMIYAHALERAGNNSEERIAQSLFS